MERIHFKRSMLLVALMVCLLLVACGGTGAGEPTDDTGGNGDTPVNSTNAPDAGSGSGSGVTGTVTDANGAPLAGVLVTPQSTGDPAVAIPEIAVMTDEQGKYTWNLPAGPYTMTFAREGFANSTQTVEVADGQLATLDVQLQPQ